MRATFSLMLASLIWSPWSQSLVQGLGLAHSIGPNRIGILTWRWEHSQLAKRSGFVSRILNDVSSPEEQQHRMKSTYLWSYTLSSPCNFFVILSLPLSYVLLSALFSDILILYSSLRKRDHVSHPYKITEVIIFYILIIRFLDRMQECKRFCTDW
jgi:hypothetical protein